METFIVNLINVLTAHNFFGAALFTLSIAFGLWALVVKNIGTKLISKLDLIARVLDNHERRLIKIEGFIEIKHEDFKPYREVSLFTQKTLDP